MHISYLRFVMSWFTLDTYRSWCTSPTYALLCPDSKRPTYAFLCPELHWPTYTLLWPDSHRPAYTLLCPDSYWPTYYSLCPDSHCHTYTLLCLDSHWPIPALYYVLIYIHLPTLHSWWIKTEILIFSWPFTKSSGVPKHVRLWFYFFFVKIR